MWSKHNSKSKINTKLTSPRKPPTKNTHPDNTNMAYIGCGRATIFDLQPKDKAKIGNLIRKVVELDTECKSTQQKAKQNETKLEKQLTALKSQNKEIIKQHTKLRSKFQKSLKLLQDYQVRLNQMDTLQSEQMKTLKNKSISKQIQQEITDLKQLILELHNKEQIKLEKLEKEQEKQHKDQLRSSRHSMIYDANNSIINDKDSILSDINDEIDEIDELQSISPIQTPILTPKSHHHPPSPHPYPIKTKTKTKTKTKMSLSQLRKYRIPSTTNTSSPSFNKLHKNNNNKKSNKMYSMTLHKDRLNQLLRIQSGNFKKDRKNDRKNENIQSNKNNMHTSSSFSYLIKKNENICNNNNNDRALRRVQSEKGVEINYNDQNHNDCCIDSGDDQIDRLSNYESLNLGLSFPETDDDDLSDQEDELLLIQHLNIIPQ